MTYLSLFGIAFIIVHTISILFITRISLAKRLFLAGWIALMVVGAPIVYNYLPFWAFALLALCGLGIYVFLLLFQNDSDVRRPRTSSNRPRRKKPVTDEMPTRRYLDALKNIDDSSVKPEPKETEDRVFTNINETRPVSSTIPVEEERNEFKPTEEELTYTEFVMEEDPVPTNLVEDKKTKAIKYALQVDAMLEDGEHNEIVIPKPQVIKFHQPVEEVQATSATEEVVSEMETNSVPVVNEVTDTQEVVETPAQMQDVAFEDISITEPYESEEVEIYEPVQETNIEETVEAPVVQPTTTQSLEQLFFGTTESQEDPVMSEVTEFEEVTTANLEEMFQYETNTVEVPTNSAEVEHAPLYAEGAETIEYNQTGLAESEFVEWTDADEAEVAMYSTETLMGESAQMPDSTIPADAVAMVNNEVVTVEVKGESTPEVITAEGNTVVEEPALTQPAFELTPLDEETVEVIKVKIANDGPLSVEEQLDREFYFQFIMYEIKELVSLGMYQQTVDYLKEILIDSYDKNLRREALDLLEMVKIDMYDPKINERIKKEYQQLKERKVL